MAHDDSSSMLNFKELILVTSNILEPEPLHVGRVQMPRVGSRFLIHE